MKKYLIALTALVVVGAQAAPMMVMPRVAPPVIVRAPAPVRAPTPTTVPRVNPTPKAETLHTNPALVPLVLMPHVGVACTDEKRKKKEC